MNEVKWKWSLVYQVYIIREGLLKVPPDPYHWNEGTIDHEHDTMESAIEQIKKSGRSEEFVILPVMITRIDWGEE